MVLYNHGTSDEKNCRRNLSGIVELPLWARRIDGMPLLGSDGGNYEIEVDFLCTNEDPGSFQSDAAACDLTVCKRAGAIAEAIDRRARKVPRRQIFLAGHSAGAWASLLVKRHAPRSLNGLILTAPAFGGKRQERTCARPACDPDEAPALRRMRIRAHHEAHLADNQNGASLNASIAAFPCDDFGWPSELPLGSQHGVELHVFPPVESIDRPLACAEPSGDRYYNGVARRFCRKIQNRNSKTTPLCSAKRIAFCPEAFRALCKERSHLFFDDFTRERPWVLEPPVFTDRFVGEGIILDFIQSSLERWRYGAGKPIDSPVCGFMVTLPLCRPFDP